jgi:hypothetical protein
MTPTIPTESLSSPQRLCTGFYSAENHNSIISTYIVLLARGLESVLPGPDSDPVLPGPDSDPVLPGPDSDPVLPRRADSPPRRHAHAERALAAPPPQD